jgi:hypothetical protein
VVENDPARPYDHDYADTSFAAQQAKNDENFIFNEKSQYMPII